MIASDPPDSVCVGRSRAMRRVLVFLGVGLALLGLGTGCRGNDQSTGEVGIGVRGDITVAAAASLAGAFDQVARRFEERFPGVKVRISFASSAALAQQIEHGAPIDVFASADVYSMADAVMTGRAVDPVTFATNQLAVITPAGNPAGLGTWRDIGRPGLQVALCVREAPCGRAAREVIGRAGLTEPKSSAELDVRAVLNRVESGEVDAGMVYATDARAAGSRVVTLPIPAADNVVTGYQIAAIGDSGNGGGADAFVAFVAFDPVAREILRQAGFGPPPDESPAS